MTIVGLIGGIAPESTIDYYRQIIAAFRDQDPERRHPGIVITSLNLPQVLELLNAGRLDELAEVLAAEVARLERAGAAFGAITSNTTHLVFDAVVERSTLPLLSIVETACAAAVRAGMRRPALVGTRFLMEAPLYPEVFARAGLPVLLPSPDDRAVVHDKYMNEFVAGVFTPETRATFVAIAERLRDRDGADGLILGGTEIPLLLRGVEIPGLPLLDTTRVHVNAIVERLRRTS
jgi:aspartate racemase